MANSTWWLERRNQFLKLQNSDDQAAVESLISQSTAEIDPRDLGLDLHKVWNEDTDHPMRSATESPEIDPFLIWIAALKKHNPGLENSVFRTFSVPGSESLGSLCRASADLCRKFNGLAEQRESHEEQLQDINALKREVGELRIEVISRVPSAPKASPDDFEQFDDYKIVKFDKRWILLTNNQAAVVKKMDELRLLGVFDVPHATLKEAMGRGAGAVKDSFKKSPAWKTLVIPNKKPKGSYRLNVPKRRVSDVPK